jgi:nicotinamide riboside kinase
MSKIFIIEGADNTGKTCLAKFLAQQFRPAVYFHFDKTENLVQAGAMHDYHYSVLKNMVWVTEHLNLRVVLDRGWLSELVYGQAIGPVERLANFRHQSFQELLKDVDVTYIYAKCLSSRERHVKEEHDHQKYSLLDYDKIVLGYDRLFEALGRSPANKIVTYNMDEQGAELSKFAASLV